MKKIEKLRLARDIHGLGLSRCPEHDLLLQRHEDVIFIEPEGCWDCPYFDENGKQCEYHIPEFKMMPWTGIDFDEELNEVQKHRNELSNAYKN